ncbi:MAG: hypothetical protein Tsb0021_11300 [Chlamydiales bacterium]
MFEITLALKYLVPRWRQLSTSLISLISVLVIALVVWLILVFFSVANGLEKIWTHKMVAVTAPIRITPKESYYHSYYFLIDSIAETSGYRFKSLHEKRISQQSDPYDPEFDEEIPSHWPAPERYEDGSVKDLVKELFATIEEIPGAQAEDYEVAYANVKIGLSDALNEDQTYISQAVYLGSLDRNNGELARQLVALNDADYMQLLRSVMPYREKLHLLLSDTSFNTFIVPVGGWRVTSNLLPKSGEAPVQILLGGNKIPNKGIFYQDSKALNRQTEFLSQAGFDVLNGTVNFSEKTISYLSKGALIQSPLETIPLYLAQGTKLKVYERGENLSKDPWEHSHHSISCDIGTCRIEGLITPVGLFPINWTSNTDNSTNPLWITSSKEGTLTLPNHPELGEPVILPKTFKEGGVKVGHKGAITYFSPTASSIQEQQIPIYIAGFYDQGIMPIGGKFVLTDRNITSTVRSSYHPNDGAMSNGINVRIPNLEQAEKIKSLIMDSLSRKKIDHYWKVETYRDFDFTRDVLQQLKSEKTLFSLIAGIIILVACSNIVSMLIILVNDKRMEIGILRAMGASSGSIALIFGFCGVMMGLAGSAIGIGMALVTLNHIDSLIGFIGAIQGHDVFNTLFYGDSLPGELSGEALSFVLISTGFTSLIAGIVPAVKAAWMRPSAILRSE